MTLMACDSLHAQLDNLADCKHKDMLDDFKDVKIDPQKASVSGAAPDSAPASATTSETKTQFVPPVPGPAEVAGEKGGEDALSDDEFAKQLQAGMAELMGELESSVQWLTTFFIMDCAANIKPAGSGSSIREHFQGTWSSSGSR